MIGAHTGHNRASLIQAGMLTPANIAEARPDFRFQPDTRWPTIVMLRLTNVLRTLLAGSGGVVGTIPAVKVGYMILH